MLGSIIENRWCRSFGANQRAGSQRRTAGLQFPSVNKTSGPGNPNNYNNYNNPKAHSQDPARAVRAPKSHARSVPRFRTYVEAAAQGIDCSIRLGLTDRIVSAGSDTIHMGSPCGRPGSPPTQTRSRRGPNTPNTSSHKRIRVEQKKSGPPKGTRGARFPGPKAKGEAAFGLFSCPSAWHAQTPGFEATSCWGAAAGPQFAPARPRSTATHATTP
jgi:hypothetical protein